MKVCSKCKVLKELSEFSKGNDKYGLQYKCKDCVKEHYENNKEQILKKNKKYRENNREKIAKQEKEHYENNKEKIAAKNKEYRENNREKIKENKKEYRENNKEKISKKDKKYRENNKEKISKKDKKYRENNKEKIAAKNKEYRENNKKKIVEYKKEYGKNNKEKIAEKQKIKYKININYKLSSLLRSRINKAIKNNQKQGSAVRDLGCSTQFLKEYLEQQFKSSMNWENYGEVWQIDHIIPLNAFDLTNKFQFLAACYYENLQPLYVEENLKKGDNYNQKDFKEYLKHFRNITNTKEQR